MPDIADVAWSEHDERNSEAVPNGWPTGAFPAYTDLVGQMMMGATKRFWNKINPVYQTSGTGDNYVVQTEIGIDQINLYEILCIRIDRSNTTPTPTLQFGATNARTIVKAGPSGYVPLAAGDMFAGNSHTFWYNGAFYILVDPAIIVGGTVQPYSPNLTTWAAITRAAGFDAWVATPSSANLAALVGDETGSGKLVFATGPTLSAPLLAGGTSGTTTLQASANASGTLTLPAATDTLVGRTTTDTFLNKTYDTAGAGNSFLINGLAATANTGTGPVVRGTSPTFVTPSIGAATGTSLQLSGLTASSAVATDISKNLVSVTNTGSGNNVLATSPTLVTPVLGVATATSIATPLVIGGSGTTGTQLTLQSTTGAGTTDTIALVGGNNGATTFGTFGTINLNLPQTTASTSKTTGALVVGGGIGAGGAIWAGGAIHPGPGSFVVSTPQIYTDSNLGIVITAGTGASTDFGFYSATGTALLSNPTGTANLALCQTANGTAAVATTPIAGAHLAIGAGTTAKAPLEFTSGTNKTSVAAGDWEFDGNAFYASCVASARQVVAAKQISTVQGTTNALSNSSTSAQSIFQSGRSTLTLAAGTSYRFRARLGFNTGATSHTTAFGFGGTATFTTINYTATATSTSIGTPAAAQVTPVNVATATVLTAASTAARTEIRLEGIVRINAAGTVIPQVTFSAGPTGTCETALDSFIEFEPIGSNTATSVGNWA